MAGATVAASKSGGLLATFGGAKLLTLVVIAVTSAALAAGTTAFVVGNEMAGSHASGTSGTPGATGAPGAPGAGTSWGTLSLSFVLGGKTQGLAITGSSCLVEPHGAYACNLNVTNSGNATMKVTGLSYAANPNLYYAGADPTMGWIFLPAGTTTNFSLWFQDVGAAGNSVVTVTVLIASETGGS